MFCAAEGDLNRDSPSYLGKVRSNFMGTEFQVSYFNSMCCIVISLYCIVTVGRYMIMVLVLKTSIPLQATLQVTFISHLVTYVRQQSLYTLNA